MDCGADRYWWRLSFSSCRSSCRSRDRVQQLLVPSRSPTSLLLEVLTVFIQDRFQRRFLDLFTPMCTCPTLPSGLSSATPEAAPTSGTDAHKRLSGSHHLPSRWSGSARGTTRVVFGTGTDAPVPVVTLFLLCLLSEAHRGEGLGIPSHLLGCHLWQTCSVSACCLRRTRWLLGLVASVSCVLLARQWIQYIRQSSVAFGCYFAHFSVQVGLGS